MDDSTMSYPLQQGDTSIVISFPQTSLLDRFTFVNENAAAQGDVTISVANYQLPPASPKWTVVNGNVAFSEKRHFNLSIVGVEARYVKLDFHVRKGGEIAALGLYGGESLHGFAQRSNTGIRTASTFATRRLEDMLNFNFANVYARARVVFVSSGVSETARRMIDDDTTTAFRFAASDPNPTTVVELADTERLHRVSALYKMQDGRMDVYLLNKLASDPSDLRGGKLVASVADQSGSGKAAVQFDPQGARYVAFRWTPAAGAIGNGFEVAEVNAFGDMPLALLNTYAAPELYASNELDFPTDRGVDFSNKLGTLADPPVLQQVSP
jgi:hypothetical protein